MRIKSICFRSVFALIWYVFKQHKPACIPFIVVDIDMLICLTGGNVDVVFELTQEAVEPKYPIGFKMFKVSRAFTQIFRLSNVLTLLIGTSSARGPELALGHLVLPPPPPLRTCLCSNCWDQCSQICRVFSRLYTLNTPRYFLDFAFSRA